MNFSEYGNKIFTRENLDQYVSALEQELEEKKRELELFKKEGEERLKLVEGWNAGKNFTIQGRTFREGKQYSILFIRRYEDSTQNIERYSFDQVEGLRDKMQALKTQFETVDWSDFEEEV